MEARGRKLSDCVYLLNDPGPSPDVELVFIHGLRVTEEKDAYWNTWLARDGTGHTCWPATWLQRSDSFPVSARVLSLNYDSSAKMSAKEGRFDLVSLGESLLQEMFLVDPGIGQSNCPVVFVCHSLGGIVAKKIVVTAKRRLVNANDENANLLRNLLGFFYYATPHSGSTLFKELCQVPSARQGPLLKFSKELDTETSRVNGEFQSLKNSQEYKDVWKFYAVAESCAIVQNGKEIDTVKYASARYFGIDDFVEIQGANHFTVCQPEREGDSSVQYLKKFLKMILPTDLR